MKALLDTHALIYMAASPERLGKAARECLMGGEAELFASLASLWEICIKSRLGKLQLPVDPGEFWRETLSRARVMELPIDRKSILKTSDLELSNRDPFDRIIAAQAIVSASTLISSDGSFDAWGVERLW
jgi:PIN domain nuclease of toxin-antitoxin system